MALTKETSVLNNRSRKH